MVVPTYSEDLYYHHQERPGPAGPTRTCSSAARAMWPACPSAHGRCAGGEGGGEEGAEGAGGAGMGWRGGIRAPGGLGRPEGEGAGARRPSGGLARSRTSRGGSIAIT